MDWTLGHTDSFEFIRVRASDMHELETLGCIKPGGTVTLDFNTDLKASGSVEAVGPLGIGSDLIRIYLTASQGGGSIRVALATMFASTPSWTVTDAYRSAKVDLYSVLLALSEDCFEESYTVPVGTNAVDLAASLATGAGLAVRATPSTAVTTAAATFAIGDSKLKVINYLLDLANYYSAQVDGYGNVLMVPYQSPATRQPVWTFEDGDRSIFEPSVEDAFDWYGTPNVVVCYTSNADTTLVATAVNDGTGIYMGSPFSTVARGRRISKSQSYTDIADQAALQTKADALLLSSSSVGESYTVKHAFAPFGTGDVVRLTYGSQGIDAYGTVQSMDMALTPGVPTTSKVRRVVHG